MKLLFLLATSLTLFGCNQTHEIIIVKDYTEVEKRIGWNQVFDFEGEYLIYFYSENCAHCRLIKEQILMYYSYHYEQMYFVCTDEYVVFNKDEDLIDVDNIDDFYIYGTPFMIRVFDHKVVSVYAGTNIISEYIDSKMQK